MRRVGCFLVVFVLVPLVQGASAQSLEEGITLLTKGKTGEAKRVFESVIRLNDNDPEAHYRLGKILMMRDFRNEDDAVENMEKAVEINPENADYQFGLGAAYGVKAQNAGIIKQAFLAPKIKGAFEKAVALNPKLADAHMGLAQYYWRAPGIMGGDMQKAWREADSFIELDELRGRPFKASMYISEKMNTEALQEMKTLTLHRSDDWRAWRAAGAFYWRNKFADEAVISFEKYVALRPDTSDSHHFLARAYLQKKDGANALLQAKKALALAPDNVNALEVVAQAYEMNGQKREALENYRRLLSMDVSPEYRKTLEQKTKDLQ